ncbi:bacteriohemerythrin [Magnetovibrio sp. PR-2]|uniref:bacteriohemerythrin n=1 Tax=Magnetovibrio sp. PR-2 TaxID=3120356 RepID=UPI002FCE14AB
MVDQIVWTEDMSVGCKQLDDDHKILVQALNDFIEAVENDEGVFVTDGIFSVLLDYSNFHFAREEAIMEACGYADLDNHKQTHNSLKEQLLDARRRYMLNPSPDLEDEIRDFLLSWLQSHILVSDMDYKSAIAASGADIDAVLKDVA